MRISQVLQNIAAPDSYGAQLDDERWKAMARNIRHKSENVCSSCKQRGKKLHVHHITYEPGKKAWEYSEENFVCFCEECHGVAHKASKYFNALISRQNTGHSCALLYQCDKLIQAHGITWLLRRLVELESKE